jgi:DNA-binding NarL/FixJ family response regulator
MQTEDRSTSAQLSLREKQIVNLVTQAKLNKEIAHELQLAEGTIKVYLVRLFRKIGVTNRTQLALWAMNALGEKRPEPVAVAKPNRRPADSHGIFPSKFSPEY